MPRAAKNSEQQAAITTADPRWPAVHQRDPQADGTFVYAVKSTGVYCRPSCAARLARPENVRFYPTPAAAEADGYRACKRCRPKESHARGQQEALIATLCRRIEDPEQEEPTLKQLASLARMSTFHLHRIFRAVTGVTPKAYAQAHRRTTIRQKLRSSHTVTEAIYDAGYNSSSRFYDNANHVLGMTPSNFRQGGRSSQIRFAVGQCTLGAILVAQSDRGICAISLGDDPERLVRELQDRFPEATLHGDDPVFAELVAKIVGLVDTPSSSLDLPLDIRGTAFQQRVWQVLRRLPAGCTATYAEIAQQIGAPRSVRAVAQACAANTLAVAIPCHRIIRSDGNLSGYRWGVERKRLLLDKECEASGSPGRKHR